MHTNCLVNFCASNTLTSAGARATGKMKYKKTNNQRVTQLSGTTLGNRHKRWIKTTTITATTVATKTTQIFTLSPLSMREPLSIQREQE